MKTRSISVGGVSVAPGEHKVVDLPVANLYTHAQLALPVHVINSKREGPTLFLTAAIHGDELNGVDVIRRVLKLKELKRLRGQLLAVPIVNVFGFIYRSRYLPDRRDLNRSFPGREKGSIAARLANIVATEIIMQSDFGIDLHTGAIERSNLPQIRGNLSDPKVLELAQVFGTPVIIDATLRDGSLRAFAAEHEIPMLLYEAGEALRFDKVAIKAGVQGVRRVMRELGMLPAKASRSPKITPVISHATSWARAPCSGIVHSKSQLGERVSSDQVLAVIGDPFGESQSDVLATKAGVIIGKSNSPLAHEGDALFHIAQFENTKEAEETVEEFRQAHAPIDELF